MSAQISVKQGARCLCAAKVPLAVLAGVAFGGLLHYMMGSDMLPKFFPGSWVVGGMAGALAVFDYVRIECKRIAQSPEDD